MPIGRLDHYNVVTADPDETLRFYCDGLGLVNDPDRRPNFGVPGAWLFAGDDPLVHLMFVDDDPGTPAGPLDHVAFDGGSHLEGMCARLERAGISYDRRDHPSGAFSQLFLRDPNGIRIEINLRPTS